MSMKRYSERLNDRLFLFEYVRVCSACYAFVQEFLRDDDTLSAQPAALPSKSIVEEEEDENEKGADFAPSETPEEPKGKPLNRTLNPSRAGEREEKPESHPRRPHSSKLQYRGVFPVFKTPLSSSSSRREVGLSLASQTIKEVVTLHEAREK